jgi:GTP-binding protein HflX
VYQVLEEIGVKVHDVLLVLNKVDRIDDQSLVDVLRRKYTDTVSISAATGFGLDRLSSIVADRLSGGFTELEIETAVGNGRLFAWLTQHAQELDRRYPDPAAQRVCIRCRIPRQAIGSMPREDVTIHSSQTGEAAQPVSA